MLVPAAMVMADNANRRHVLSAQPQAPTIDERPTRRRGTATRRLTASALRRLAAHVEPHPVTPAATA